MYIKFINKIRFFLILIRINNWSNNSPRNATFLGYLVLTYFFSIFYHLFNRIVDYFAKRPQVQERLTMQIVAELQNILNTQDVACVIDAKHLCVNSRGIRDIDSSTVTSEFGGRFKENNTKQEFLEYIKLPTSF